MINAAAMFFILWGLWLLLAQQGLSLQALGVGAGVALACVIIAARLGAVSGRGAYAYALRLLGFVAGRAGVVVSGALSAMRAAVAADVTLKPALVRIKTRATTALSQAVLADLISAAPGAVVVEADAAGLLVHVLDEDSIDAQALSQFEARVIAAIDGKAAT
jgi:multisubunit Na+/H+ antiporter MnhE subunit